MKQRSLNVGIVGATGAVGFEVVKTLEQRHFPISNLKLFCSPKNAGKKIQFQGGTIVTQALQDEQSFHGLDIVFFTAGGVISEKHAPRAAAAGAFVIDNSSFFRLNADVPLVVPEVNGETILMAKEKRIIANPNCTTAQMVLALKPLHDKYKIKRIVLSSYQAVSGKGQKGIDEFLGQIQAFVDKKPMTVQAFTYPIAFNCIPHIDTFRSDGFTGEEYKVMAETKKILGSDTIRVVATCVRVPVLNGHSESIQIETQLSCTPIQAREALEAAAGITVVDDVEKNAYPLAQHASGGDAVLVGRIRSDVSLEDPSKGLVLWVVGDNLRKGAALNAVQIAELLVQKQML